MEPSKKPLNVLVKQLNSNVSITLKNGLKYNGKIVRCDGFMNILLDGAKEYYKDEIVASYGSVLVRGNNILYVILEPTKNF